MGYKTREHEQKLIHLLLDAHPEGATISELAGVIGVSGDTIRNYLDNLHDLEIVVNNVGTVGKGRYCIDPQTYIRPLQLTLAQAWYLYLPLRRMVRSQLQRYPLVQSLLKRLASTLHPTLVEPLQIESESITQETDFFKQLVQAWQEKRCVEIKYQPLDKTFPSHLVIAPYWFEPAVWSDSNYLIAGQLSHHQFIPITLKLDRILAVKSLLTPFEHPDVAQLLQRIEATWGIWTADLQPPQPVKLRFSPRALTRLRETRWHPTQKIEVTQNGYVIWTALIAEPQEMLPWIRGWGLDVEVLEPHTIRTQIVADLQRTLRLYGIQDQPDEPSFF